MSDSDSPYHDSKHISALGVWKDNFSTILHHRGSTFHKLTIGRSYNTFFLNLEETVFALLRTNFLLLDYHTRSVVGPYDILNDLFDNFRLADLLKIHVYLALQRLGRSPRSLQDSFPSTPAVDPDVFQLPDFTPNHKLLELHSLLDFFKTRKLNNLTYKTEFLSPVFSVDHVDCFITMPDSPASNILDSLIDLSNIIAVSDLDSVYFLTLSPVIF
ncbi:conserved hypothetical protein [Theileria orientalis strain Shintoku]|uniref:Uncharacterized protein n=1 Tax=Theileria orientalis strain Shintoku TaxID=869250 RepID=J4D845_THEOR|nr:conserved hypothetical protein [Theileria orientalis strain Shintoku]PVC53349.1 hypothetical protein MACL_00000140 [Theileria orientalis]BAM40560.1 conserved hypothetical protein [Theileria orientalis strain Shintoku]|eukprot:XP_009690861.1 conserved hypothetical protein [Theileria orientalis strain Shintoku]